MDRWHEVICTNCGMELPDWAMFCDRCGTRVQTPEPTDDPIDQVGLEIAADPLWTDDSVPDEPSEEVVDSSPDKTEFVAPSDLVDDSVSPSDADGAEGETVLMAAPPEGDEPSGERTVLMDAPADEEEAESAAEPSAEEDAPEDAAGDVPEDELARDEEGSDEEPDEPEPDDAAGDLEEADGNPEKPSDEQPDASDEDTSDEDASGEGDAADDGRDDEDEGREETEDGKGAPDGWPYPEPFETIEVGMDGGWYEKEYYVSDPWRGRRRPSERLRENAGPNVLIVAGVAAGAIALSFLVTYLTVGRSISAPVSTESQEVIIPSRRLSRRKGNELIATLDGWWKTNRTFDGRYWHLQSGLMELYAADGKLASQTLLDPTSIEQMEAGPGDIEVAGYYLRDIGFYVGEENRDLLYAIDQDGSADEDANLHRSDPPSFITKDEGEDGEPEEVVVEDPSEYLLPESATRAYSASELEGMSNHDLFVARNEIYARHGYVFETGELSEYFLSKSWYQPSEVFNEGALNEIERQNVSTILSVEQSRGSQYV